MGKYNDRTCYNAVSSLLIHSQDYKQLENMLKVSEGANARQFLQGKQDNQFNLFKRELETLVKNCGLPEQTCGKKCKEVAVEDRD